MMSQPLYTGDYPSPDDVADLNTRARGERAARGLDPNGPPPVDEALTDIRLLTTRIQHIAYGWRLPSHPLDNPYSLLELHPRLVEAVDRLCIAAANNVSVEPV